MKLKLKISFLLVLASILSYSSIRNLYMSNVPFIATFNNLEEFKKNWKDNSWKSPASFQLVDENLKITTRPNTNDRVKIRSKKTFTTGLYTWRIYVPKFKMFEQVSIGAFLYHNEKDEFEFDFEIGSGQQQDRERINLKEDEAIVYCVSQFSPSSSHQFPVKINTWSTFSMKLNDMNGYYFVEWFINDNKVKELQTQVKSNIQFKVHCSLENLSFMGDVASTQENYVLFDSFSYSNNM
ncbi:MAG: hypothetical protein HWD82_06240 [Flavobacteriaceae bacterium]|nr:hypothetical protein [Flavobacteriaceae bacterium]